MNKFAHIKVCLYINKLLITGCAVAKFM